MSYLLFFDESGHDHRSAPYEVNGGIAIRVDRLWPFIQSVKALEAQCFGAALQEYGKEIKGQRLLDKDRFRWAAQAPTLDEQSRRKHAIAFLEKGALRLAPTRVEFTAYGQACLMLARSLFDLLRQFGAKIIATAIPATIRKPPTFEAEEFLRKDIVFLLERYFYLLEKDDQNGLIVMDQTERQNDARLIRRMERYFTLTARGRYRSSRIVPCPLFVDSDMAYPIQVADVCIYCINFGYRIPSSGMEGQVRQEIKDEFGNYLADLQFEARRPKGDGTEFTSFGICYVANPYAPGRQ